VLVFVVGAFAEMPEDLSHICEIIAHDLARTHVSYYNDDAKRIKGMCRQRIQKALGHTAHRGWARLLLNRARGLFLSRAIDETDSPSVDSGRRPAAWVNPGRHNPIPSSFLSLHLLQVFFWCLVIEPQLLGLGGRIPAAAAATGAFAAFLMYTSHSAPS